MQWTTNIRAYYIGTHANNTHVHRDIAEGEKIRILQCTVSVVRFIIINIVETESSRGETTRVTHAKSPNQFNGGGGGSGISRPHIPLCVRY